MYEYSKNHFLKTERIFTNTNAKSNAINSTTNTNKRFKDHCIYRIALGRRLHAQNLLIFTYMWMSP